MTIPVHISFRNMDPPLGAEERIRDRAAALTRFFPRVTACRVVVERRHHRRRKGDLFHLHVSVTVPGAELVVSREPGQDHTHEDLLASIRDAFDEVRRQLEDHARKVRADTKLHEVHSHGRIVRLFPDEGYGFIETGHGGEVYFQRQSVTDGSFDDLRVGAEVRYFSHPGEGEKGEQASSVTPIGKHHLPPTAHP